MASVPGQAKQASVGGDPSRLTQRNSGESLGVPQGQPGLRSFPSFELGPRLVNGHQI